MKKKLKWIAAGLLAIFVVLQLFNPERTNPAVINDFLTTTKPPATIAATIRASCYDCHSDETIWPFYSRVAPISWLVAHDVNEGRDHLDFSDWPTEPEIIAKRLDRVNEVLDYREMPPKKYTLIHVNARLTEAQRKEIMDWTDVTAAKLRAAVTNK